MLYNFLICHCVVTKCALACATERLPVCEWKVVWCHGTTCGRGNSCWLQLSHGCTHFSLTVGKCTYRDGDRPHVDVTFISLFVRLFTLVCSVWLTEEERHLESGVSPRDVSLWCFPTQRSGTDSDEDMMSSSSFLFQCSHTSAATFLLLQFRPFFLSCVFFRVFLCACFPPSLSLLLLGRGVGVRWLFLFYRFFFYEWDVLFTPSAISVLCADDEHIKCDHTTSSSVISLPLIG